MAGMLLLFYLDGFVLGEPVPLLLAYALLGLPVLAGFLHHGDHGPSGSPHPRPVLLAAAGAVAVLALSRAHLSSGVLAAALVGSGGGLLERLSRGRGPMRDGAAPLYCGAFAGMTSELVLRHPGLQDTVDDRLPSNQNPTGTESAETLLGRGFGTPFSGGVLIAQTPRLRVPLVGTVGQGCFFRLLVSS